MSIGQLAAINNINLNCGTLTINKFNGALNSATTVSYVQSQLDKGGTFLEPNAISFLQNENMPSNPSIGDTYIVLTGVLGYSPNSVYTWTSNGTWSEIIPVLGNIIMVSDIYWTFDTNGWDLLTNTIKTVPELSVTSTVASSSVSTGALIVSGGIGIGNVSCNYLKTYGNYNTTDSTHGDIVTAGGIGIGMNLYVSGTSYSNNSSIYGGTDSTGPGNGALVISGGLGMTGSMYLGGSINQSGSTNTFTGQMLLNNTTDSSSTTTGALVISGGMSLGQHLYLGGSIHQLGPANYFNGQTYINDSTTSSSTNTGALIVTGGIGTAELYCGYLKTTGGFNTTDAVNGDIVTAGGIGVGMNLYVAGTIYAAANVDATGTGTGSLQVTGGLSCTNTAYVGGELRAYNGYIYGGSDSSSTSSGAIVISGGVGMSGSLWTGGQANCDSVWANGSYAATGQGTGSLKVTGGASITGDLYIGQTLRPEYLIKNTYVSAILTSNTTLPNPATYDVYFLVCNAGITVNLPTDPSYYGQKIKYVYISTNLYQGPVQFAGIGPSHYMYQSGDSLSIYYGSATQALVQKKTTTTSTSFLINCTGAGSTTCSATVTQTGPLCTIVFPTVTFVPSVSSVEYLNFPSSFPTPYLTPNTTTTLAYNVANGVLYQASCQLNNTQIVVSIGANSPFGTSTSEAYITGFSMSYLIFIP